MIPQLQAPLSLLLRYVGVATVSTIREANTLARRAFVWAQTPLRSHVPQQFCVVGWSVASWACRREISSQGGHLLGITNTAVLEQTEWKVSVISWHSGQLARVARSSNAAERQAAVDPEGELTNVAAQVRATLVLDSRGVYDALARSESLCLGLKDKR